MKTAIEKIRPVLAKIKKAKALDRITIAKRVRLKPDQVSYSLSVATKKGEIFKTSRNPYLWYGIPEPEEEKEPELKFKEIIEDKLIPCLARGENRTVLISECVFNDQHPSCQLCKEGLREWEK